MKVERVSELWMMREWINYRGRRFEYSWIERVDESELDRLGRGWRSERGTDCRVTVKHIERLDHDEVDRQTREREWQEMKLWGRILRGVCWTVMTLCMYEGWVVGRSLYVSDRSLYSLRSVIVSQWRERKIGVKWQDLAALTTARANEFWKI